eukprot:COSAG03_NODE_431_length_7966_cov_4.105123_4_plen_731_part_00
METAGEKQPSEGIPPEVTAAPEAQRETHTDREALPVVRKAGWLEMKMAIGWSRRFVRVEQGSLCRWHEDVTLSLSNALKSKGLVQYEAQLAEIGVSTVPAMSALDCAGADAARLAGIGMDAAELARFVQLAQQWRKSISTFRRIDLRSCSLQEVDGRRFALTGPDGSVVSMRGSVPGDTALWVSAVQAELAELEAGAPARQSLSQMGSDVGELLERLTADDDSQADTAAQLRQLMSVVSTADCDLSVQIVTWLALRLQVDSTPVKLKTLNLVHALASSGAHHFCRALVRRPDAAAGECPANVMSGVMLAVKYEVEPHPQYGDKPQQLVRNAAMRCADLLENTATLHTPKKPTSSSKPGFFSKMSPVVSLALSESVSAARNLFESTDGAEERELQRLEDLIAASNKPLFVGDRVRYSEGRLEGVIQSISTLSDGRVTCKVRIDDDSDSTVGSDTAAAERGEKHPEGTIRTYFLQDLHPIPKMLWEPRKAHIKSLSKKAKSGHVSLQLEAGTLSLNSRELCFATDDGWTTTSLPWHTIKGGAAGVDINHKAVGIPVSAVASACPPAVQAALPEPEPEQEPEPEPDAAVPDTEAGEGVSSEVLKTVVVLCINRAICPRGKLEIFLPEQQAVEFERVSKAAAAQAAEWCAKLVAEDDAKKQEALALAGLAHAAGTPTGPEATANGSAAPVPAVETVGTADELKPKPVDDGAGEQTTDATVATAPADDASGVTAQ